MTVTMDWKRWNSKSSGGGDDEELLLRNERCSTERIKEAEFKGQRR